MFDFFWGHASARLPTFFLLLHRRDIFINRWYAIKPVTPQIFFRSIGDISCIDSACSLGKVHPCGSCFSVSGQSLLQRGVIAALLENGVEHSSAKLMGKE